MILIIVFSIYNLTKKINAQVTIYKYIYSVARPGSIYIDKHSAMIYCANEVQWVQGQNPFIRLVKYALNNIVK